MGAPVSQVNAGIWPFGPQDEAVASFDSSGLFGSCGGAREETAQAAPTLGQGPPQEGKPLKRTAAGLFASIPFNAVAVTSAFFVIDGRNVGRDGFRKRLSKGAVAIDLLCIGPDGDALSLAYVL